MRSYKVLLLTLSIFFTSPLLATYGTLHTLAPHTYLLEGKASSNILTEADIPNIVLHRSKDTLYILDTGSSPDFKAKALLAIDKLSPFKKVVLLSSNGHPDYVANNDIISHLQSSEKLHLISNESRHTLPHLQYYLESLQIPTQNLTYLDGLPISPEFLESLSPGKWEKTSRALGESPANQAFNRFIPYLFLSFIEQYQPIQSTSSHTQYFENTPKETLTIGKKEWSGWNIDDAIYVLEARGSSRDGLLFYLPKEKILYVGNELTIFPMWKDAKPMLSRELIKTYLSMLEEGSVEQFFGGSLHQVHSSPEESQVLLNHLLSFQDTLIKEALGRINNSLTGLSVDTLYQQMASNPSPEMQSILDNQFPKTGLFFKVSLFHILNSMPQIKKETAQNSFPTYRWTGAFQ